MQLSVNASAAWDRAMRLLLQGHARAMADTGENRQISDANAKEAEKVRASKKLP